MSFSKDLSQPISSNPNGTQLVKPTSTYANAGLEESNGSKPCKRWCDKRLSMMETSAIAVCTKKQKGGDKLENKWVQGLKGGK